MGLNVLYQAPTCPREAVLFRGPHADQLLAASQERAMSLHIARALRGLGNLARSRGESAQAAIRYDESLGADAANENEVAGAPLVHL